MPALFNWQDIPVSYHENCCTTITTYEPQMQQYFTLLLANNDTVASRSLVDWHQHCLQSLKIGPWLADAENVFESRPLVSWHWKSGVTSFHGVFLNNYYDNYSNQTQHMDLAQQYFIIHCNMFQLYLMMANLDSWNTLQCIKTLLY